MISSRLPATFLSKPIFRPPQGVSPSPAANFLKTPYQNHNVKQKLIFLLAIWGFKKAPPPNAPICLEGGFLSRSFFIIVFYLSVGAHSSLPKTLCSWLKMQKHYSFAKIFITFGVFDKKYPDFLQKLVLVEISSKTRSFDEILKVGTHTPIKPDIANLFLHENAIKYPGFCGNCTKLTRETCDFYAPNTIIDVVEHKNTVCHTNKHHF